MTLSVPQLIFYELVSTSDIISLPFRYLRQYFMTVSTSGNIL